MKKEDQTKRSEELGIEYKPTKIFIEDCFKLACKDVATGATSIISDLKTGALAVKTTELKDRSMPMVELQVNYIVYDVERKRIKWLVELFRQELKLDYRNANYGKRRYLYCGSCGKSYSNLYLKVGGSKFSCRHCHSLTYQTTTINKKSKVGFFAYYLNQYTKFLDLSHLSFREMYNGKVTRTAKRVADLENKLLAMQEAMWHFFYVFRRLSNFCTIKSQKKRCQSLIALTPLFILTSLNALALTRRYL